MSSSSNNTKQQSKGTPAPPKLENHPDTLSVLGVTTPGETILVESVTSKDHFTTSLSMGLSKKKMFPEL